MLDLVEHLEAVHLPLSSHDAIGVTGQALSPGNSLGGHDMKDAPIRALDLEVEEIESRERGGGCSTSSSTSRLCTCACKFTTEAASPAKR